MPWAAAAQTQVRTYQNAPNNRSSKMSHAVICKARALYKLHQCES